MRTRIFIFFIFILFYTPSVSIVQNTDGVLLQNPSEAKTDRMRPHLTSKLMSNEGLLLLKFKNAWKYQQGDDESWANPDYDDTAWHTIAPDGLSAKAMPDSLWQGYGWWRLSFTADSSLYQQVTRLYFRSWGAYYDKFSHTFAQNMRFPLTVTQSFFHVFFLLWSKIRR
jgi:hypothetical protein